VQRDFLITVYYVNSVHSLRYHVAININILGTVVAVYVIKFQEILIFYVHTSNCQLVHSKRDKVTGEWRKLHNEELNDLYSLPNIVRVGNSRRMRWAGHVARMGKDIGVHRVLVGKSEGKRPLGRPRRRWEDNIKMDLQEVGGSRGD
jgi:hypothetical protein